MNQANELENRLIDFAVLVIKACRFAPEVSSSKSDCLAIAKKWNIARTELKR